MSEGIARSALTRRRATADPTVPKPSKATRQQELTKCLPHLPPRDAGRELAPEPRRRPSRGCRGVSGPVPQPLLMKRVLQLDYSNRVRGMQIDVYRYVDYAEHSPSITSGANSVASA